MRSSASSVALAAAFFLAALPAPSSAATVPAIVQRAADTYAANVRGIIGMQRHFTTSLRGGPIRHTEESDSGFLMDDGAFVKIKYYRIVQDGRTFAAGQIARRDAQTNRDWSDGKIFFKEPYDPRFMRDYGFQLQACSDCPAGVVAVAFTSAVRDAQHGSGTMWIESDSALVDRLTYVPYVFPPHATSGTVTEFGGRALPDLWYVTRIDSAYRGRVFVLTGSGTFAGAFDHFRRFATLIEAQAALQDGTI